MRPFAILSPALLAIALVLSIGIGTTTRADAKGKVTVSLGKVSAACHRTPNCFMAKGPNGSATGCSPNACFTCNHGKCWADAKGKEPGKGAIIGGIRIPPGSVSGVKGGNPDPSHPGAHRPVQIDSGLHPVVSNGDNKGNNSGTVHPIGRRH